MSSADLHERVRRFIRGAEDDFDAIACAIARHQAAHITPVAQLWRSLGVDDPRRADDIPAVPTDAFRLRRIAIHPESEDARCFLTSGTTDVARGRHAMRTTETYALAALTWAREMLFPDRGESASTPMIVLASSEEQAPESSLTFMLARFAEALGGDVSWHFDGERVDVEGVLRRARAMSSPCLIAGTSFAFVHFLDTLDEAVALPAKSRVMQTGGFKGRSREVDAGELRLLIAKAFSIPDTDVIGEYGMTELSSQLYQRGESYHPPRWLRVTPVDPETLSPCDGVGLARFVDLANVDSSVAIQTADRIVREDDGSVRLLGRAPGATPRGCSLALEHLVS